MEPSGYAEQRYKDGLECARRATQYDQEGHYSAALSFYSEAVEALNQACALAPAFSPILPRLVEYGKRAEEIRLYLRTVNEPLNPVIGASSSDRAVKVVGQIEYLMESGLIDHQRGYNKEAEKLYSCAIELALQAQKSITTEIDKKKVKGLTVEALNRLENLRVEHKPVMSDKDKLLDELESLPTPSTTQPKQHSDKTLGTGDKKSLPRGPLTSFLDADQDLSSRPKFTAYSSSSNSVPRPASSIGATPISRGGASPRGAKFTDSELKVLRATSVINGVTYLPWSDADLPELRKVTPLPQDFEDPNGLPRLSDKQKSQFFGWMRPYDICDNPKMVHLISSFTIKQTLIADCSFVASLTVSADYERKFKTRLVTRLIHPQNRSGEPIMNPNGKYFVSFNLNGCRRKVVIDDRLPVSTSGQLLCSHSNNRDEFWVSLIEKAYMKVMGGYDFPGSSSNIDLHALTGWIPERINLKNAGDSTFKMMEKAVKKGSGLLTVATGEISAHESERTGLVTTHAYAVLGITEVEGLKLLQLKNPWSHKRWKGNFSENDRAHWTPQLRKALNFDQTQALQVDNGVFWIDWVSLKKFYDVAYLNWKPELFGYKSTLHDVWKPSSVEKDWYDISNNPQYCLKVNCADAAATVWVLLSRHITKKSDFAHNEKFITLNIARSDGKRIFYPDKFLHQGVKINTPHYLAKLQNISKGTSIFTVIVSQLESLSAIYYTLRVYSTCEISVSAVPSPYHHHQQLKGVWRPGEKSSQRFTVTTTSVNNTVLVKLQAPKELFVWLEMNASSNGTGFHRVDAGAARPGFIVLETGGVPKGNFVVSPVCYSKLPPKPVHFFVTVFCDNVFNFSYGQ